MRNGEPVVFCRPTRDPPARCPACGRDGLVPYGADFDCNFCRVVFTPAALTVGRQIEARAEFEARGRVAREVASGEG